MNLLTVGNNVEPITLRKLLETYSNRTTDSVTSCGGNSISSYIYMHCILVEGMSAVLIHRDISLRYLSLIRNGSEVNVIMLPSNASGQAFFWLFSMYGSSHCSKGYWKSIPQGGLFGISKSNWLLLINLGIQIWCTLKLDPYNALWESIKFCTVIGFLQSNFKVWHYDRFWFGQYKSRSVIPPWPKVWSLIHSLKILSWPSLSASIHIPCRMERILEI